MRFGLGDVLLAVIVAKAPEGSSIQIAASQVLAVRVANEISAGLLLAAKEQELETARWADDGGRP
jgi:hypothetical protein